MNASSSSHTAGAGSIVSLQAVTKKFGPRVAVDAVSFDVPAGSIYEIGRAHV